jgi:hypothetical protein
VHWIDPDYLPATTGTIEMFLLNPEGEPDGLVLTDGTEVHFPPHLAAQVLSSLRPGSAVTVSGIRPRGVADMIAAVALETGESVRIVDGGPPKDDKKRRDLRKRAKARRAPVDIEGVVRRPLHGPKGEVRGVLLEDGHAGRFPPHAAEAIAPLLTAGSRIVLRGDALPTEHGTVVAVRAAGASSDNLQEIAGKPHKAEHDKPERLQPSGDVDAA